MFFRCGFVVVMGSLLIAGSASGAEPSAAVRTISVVGRASSVITAKEIRLGDIAEISSTKASDDEAIIALQKIALEESPAPGREVSIPAAKVIDRMKAAGVNIDSIGYTFPRYMTAQRAARSVTEAEVMQA
ncbi:MAG: hypothetical protein RL417_662, partial [Pseudomonadota bacterium]